MTYFRVVGCKIASSSYKNTRHRWTTWIIWLLGRKKKLSLQNEREREKLVNLKETKVEEERDNDRANDGKRLKLMENEFDLLKTQRKTALTKEIISGKFLRIMDP